MEFDIGNLVYIILTIVVVAIGLMGRKKKPAGTEAGSGGSGERPGFLENLEKILNQEQSSGNVMEFMEDEPGSIYEEETAVSVEGEAVAGSVFNDEVVRSVYQDEPEERGILSEYEEIMKRQEELMDSGISSSAADSLQKPLEVIDLDDEHGTDYFEVVAEFNAATAIVYSAIINRIDY